MTETQKKNVKIEDQVSENLSDYFKTTWKTTEEDPQVIEAVRSSKNTLDVGCGHNQYKKYSKTSFWGIDLSCEEADQIIDIIDFKTKSRFDLIICYGSINFYSIQWIEDRLRHIVSLLDTTGKIMMKVNPGYPHVDGTVLDWYDKWTISLAKHYGKVFNLEITNIREAANGRFKFDYIKHD